jgi:hypothetical protein
VRAVVGLVPPLGRENFILSSSLKCRSISLYLAASEVVEDEDLVEWMMVTSNPIRLYGVFQWPASREWSSQIDRSKGWIALEAMGQCCVLRIQFVYPNQSCPQMVRCVWKFDDFISDAIAWFGFMVGLVPKAMITVGVQGGTTFAFIVRHVVEDG